MNYRRILVLAKVGSDAGPTFAALRFLAPFAEHVTVLVQQSAHQFAWMSKPAPAENEGTTLALDTLRSSARGAAARVDVRLAPNLAVDALTDMVASTGVDLVVVDSHASDSMPLVAEVRRHTSIAVLCVPEETMPTRPGAGQLLCVSLSRRERWAVAAFLKAHAREDDRAVVLSATPLSPEEKRQLHDVAGLMLDVQVVPGTAVTLRRLLAEDSDGGPQLVVVPRLPPAFLLPTRRGRPVLILPALRATAPGAEAGRTIDVPDLIDDGEAIRVRAEYAVGVGHRTPIVDQELVFVRQGSVVARAFTSDGECELASGQADGLGVFRRPDDLPAERLGSIEAPVRVLRPGARPLLLFDAQLKPDELSMVRDAAWPQPVGVRVRSTLSCRSLRARLRRAGLPPIVIDAGTVLDEGDGRDVSAVVDAVRLARTAARLRAHGFDVPAVVYRGALQPSTAGFAAVRPHEVSTLPRPTPSAEADGCGRTPAVADPGPTPDLASRLDATTGSETIPGNRIEVELDNRQARNWLLEAIAGSTRRVHFQVYMAVDDDVGRPVEAALAAAAARGVTVRVLVDSLHGLHGSFGLHNPLLARLSSRPGVELRLGKPITRESSLEDLKQRDHRKLVVVDGHVALLGGRNLSHEYYSAFDEVPLSLSMTWRMVPWLDAGARVEGPAVAALERSFLQAWQDAGGAAFDIQTSRAAGSAAARVIVHHGLRDARTVEAYVALIDSARSHVYVVNGFPLLLEIQHALLRAAKRGVRARTLVGNLTPRHAGGPFEGPWAALRTAWTSLVHSRMDPLVAAGGECYEYVVPARAEWDPSVGDLRPHVHAKTMSVDGRTCAVGSANLDVTAGYWESELLLVVEDEAIAAAVEARLDQLLATSRRLDADPDWRRRADLRRWMRSWPGVLSG